MAYMARFKTAHSCIQSGKNYVGFFDKAVGHFGHPRGLIWTWAMGRFGLWDVLVISRWGGFSKRTGSDFLAGRPEFEVTPLMTAW